MGPISSGFLANRKISEKASPDYRATYRLDQENCPVMSRKNTVIKLRLVENAVSRLKSANAAESTSFARKLYVTVDSLTIWEFLSLRHDERLRFAECLKELLRRVRPSVKMYLTLWFLFFYQNGSSDYRVAASIKPMLFNFKFFLTNTSKFLAVPKWQPQHTEISRKERDEFLTEIHELLSQIEDVDLQRFVHASQYRFLIFTSGLGFSGGTAVADHLSKSPDIFLHPTNELRGFYDGNGFPSLVGIHRASTQDLRSKILAWLSFILNLDGETAARFQWIDVLSLNKNEAGGLGDQIFSMLREHHKNNLADLVYFLLVKGKPQKVRKKIIVDNGLLATQAMTSLELPGARMVAAIRDVRDQWLDAALQDQYGHLPVFFGNVRFVFRRNRAVRSIRNASAKSPDQVKAVFFEEYVTDGVARQEIATFLGLRAAPGWTNSQSVNNIRLELPPGWRFRHSSVKVVALEWLLNPFRGRKNFSRL